MTENPNPYRQITDAYRRMATEARYRPAAPSDGFGNITAPLDKLDLNREANTYATNWRREENTQDYPIGCPSYEDRAALIFTIEAARLICGMDHRTAADLLRMAADELANRSRPNVKTSR